MLKIKRGDPFTDYNTDEVYDYIEIEVCCDEDVPLEGQKGNLLLYEGKEVLGDDCLILQWESGDWVSLTRESVAELLSYLERYANSGELIMPEQTKPREIEEDIAETLD